MYMGFMKMGLSLMLGFMILVAVTGYTNIGVLAVFPVALYVYSFFHANNMGSLDDVTFYNMEDQYLFGFDGIDHMRIRLEGRNRKVAAVILIILGVIMLWQVIFNVLCDIFGWDNRFLSAVYYFVRDELPRAVIGVAVIWAGLALIRGKRIGIEENSAAYREPFADDGRPVYGEPFADDGGGAHGEPFADDRRAAYGEPFADGRRAAYGEPFTDGRRAAYGEPFADGRRAAYGEPFTDDGRPVCGEPLAGDGRPVYKEQPAVNGYKNYREQPHKEEQPVADGKIIYAEGPVAEGQGTAGHTNQGGR